VCISSIWTRTLHRFPTGLPLRLPPRSALRYVDVLSVVGWLMCGGVEAADSSFGLHARFPAMGASRSQIEALPSSRSVHP
jgi:hypothetical protein